MQASLVDLEILDLSVGQPVLGCLREELAGALEVLRRSIKLLLEGICGLILLYERGYSDFLK